MNGVLKSMFEEHHGALECLVEEMRECLGQLTNVAHLLYSCDEWRPDVNQMFRHDLVQTWKMSVLALARITDCYASTEPFAYTEQFLESALNELERAYLENHHFFGRLLGYLADVMANRVPVADVPENIESICIHLRRLDRVIDAIQVETRPAEETPLDAPNVEPPVSAVLATDSWPVSR